MNNLRIKKGDTVKVISGSQKGKTGVVLRVEPTKQFIFIDKLGLVKRHVKPNQQSPRGGTKEVHIGFPAGKVALIVDAAKGTTSRIGYSKDKTGKKVRVAKSLKNKEIK